jgi:outer membrane receptor for ferrienterochelin and colicin
MLREKVGWLVAALLLFAASPMSAQERFGSLAGTVTDPSAAALPGTTVTATNTASGAVRTVVSGPDGTFNIPDLEPGRYNVSVELQGFQKLEANDVLVLLGRTAQLNAQLKLGQVSETVQVTADAVRQIDMKSTTVSHNITSEELDRMPKARTFQGVALTSPGVNQGDIEGGIQVNGASGAENLYTVDGVSTNSQLYGSSRQDTVFEYLQEVEVKTSGIDAEYGGALGGVISAVTKSGGNRFGGEGHYYYIGNALSAGPVPRIQLSPYDLTTVYNLQDDKQPLNQNEVGGSLGGPIVKDHLFFFGSVSPRFYRQTRDYQFSNGTEPASFDVKRTYTQAFGKVTYSNGRIQANGNVLYTPTTDTGILPAFNGLGTNYTISSLAANAPVQNYGWEIDQTNTSGNVDVWLNNSAFVSVRGGYFHDNYKDVGISNTTSYTYQQPSTNVPGLPASVSGPAGTYNVPRQIINYQDLTTRPFIQADYNQSFKAAGSHLLKAGIGYQNSTNNVDQHYPGGYVYIYWGQSFKSGATGQVGTGTYGYYRVDNYGTLGNAGGNITSLFVQDTWTPVPKLTLNLGLRSENEKIPSLSPDTISPQTGNSQYAIAFGFGDKIAPRLGATYDVRGDGRVKAYASWGRYYDWTKYDMVRGSFGGAFWKIYYRSLDTLDINSLNLNNMPGTDLWGGPNGYRDLRANSLSALDPNLKPMYQDSTNAGLEFQVGSSSTASVSYVHNNLGRTIEDFSALINGNNVYTIGNPGEGTAAIYPASYPPTPNFPMPKPERVYDALQASITRRFSKNWFASANYTLSRLYGNYTGLANSDEIDTPTTGVSAGTSQQQAGSIARPGTNVSSAFDTDTLLFDSKGNIVYGRLPTDRPHVVKLYGAYTFNFGTQVGVFFYGASGTPVTTYVNSLDLEPLMVNGRGDMGRTPVLTRTDLLVSHELKMGGTKKVRLEFQVQNLFNQKTATHIFNFLNKGAPGGSQTQPQYAIDMSSVDLLKGYDYKALLAATPAGYQGSLDPRYGQADLWQAGAQGQVAVKFIF